MDAETDIFMEEIRQFVFEAGLIESFQHIVDRVDTGVRHGGVCRLSFRNDADAVCFFTDRTANAVFLQPGCEFFLIKAAFRQQRLTALGNDIEGFTAADVQDPGTAVDDITAGHALFRKDAREVPVRSKAGIDMPLDFDVMLDALGTALLVAAGDQTDQGGQRFWGERRHGTADVPDAPFHDEVHQGTVRRFFLQVLKLFGKGGKIADLMPDSALEIRIAFETEGTAETQGRGRADAGQVGDLVQA